MTRKVLVTGGSGGIGKAVAARFRRAGDTVVITGRDGARLAATAKEIDAEPIACDAADPRQVRELAEAIGPELDVVVNMAGGNTDIGRPSATDLADVAASWRANLDANLLSAVLTTTAVLDKLRPGGTVINVGSIGAEYAASGYGAAKAALHAWTAGLSAAIGPQGLTANLVSPGYIEETDFFHGRLTDQRREALIAATHTGRAGNPEDIAATVEFLASTGARHITGQTVHVNGGAHTTR
ncbi:SDR family NAD(P)-dependent oxidoreductase [Kutzneria sp. 744]|uniref:SDR family NAD(P)-dependent oxidoreductase n=1 Tax=Kutzneria sp. (strain 744) TaxID=345341 RepID=UPI0003EEE1A4|nr:SDR family oxidoreductase [Kutzneria sp. 744]EWM17511.1 oxidoreductase, short-chain dehydrogenase/reductase family [Kutzneria sp. 744]